MSCAKSGAVVNGIVFVFLSISVLFADVVVDSDLDNNQNNFGYYWYYYDDNYRLGKDDRPQAAPNSTPSTILVKTMDSTRYALGDMSDTYKIKSYEFTIRSEEGNRYATVPFTFGDTWKTSWGTAYPYVGVSTMLADNGRRIDLTGATSIKFKIRSHKSSLLVRFIMQTKEIEDITQVKGSLLKGDEFGYYGYDVNVSTNWEEKEIKISDLKLPGTWARDIPFNIKSVTKLAWEIDKTYNATITGDTIDIDDIVIVASTLCEGYVLPPMNGEFTAFNITSCDDYDPIVVPQYGEFATFDRAPYNETPMKTYWYVFSDKFSGGNSVITKGAEEHPEKGYYSLSEIIENSGYTGRGLLLEGNFGKSFMQNSAMAEGFFGIGVNTYDSGRVRYWDAKNMGAKSIYFNYLTEGTIKAVTLEVKDKNDVSDADNPTRKGLRGPGIVWHRDFPGTNGRWRQLEIPFDSLKLAESAIDRTPLDVNALAKFEWKLQGSESQHGKIVIDNVYFPDVHTGCLCDNVATIPQPSQSNSFFKVKYINGNVHVTFGNRVLMKDGKIDFYNAQGKLLMTNNIRNTGTFTINLPANKFPSGLYFLKLQGINTKEKAVNTQRPINIVR